MRHYKKVCFDIGFMPREWANSQLIDGGTVRIGTRLQPRIHTNITWITDPRDPTGMKTLAQCNFESSDENRIMRVARKWGWKIVDINPKMNQRGIEESDNTSRGIVHNVELVDEVIPKTTLADYIGGLRR